MRQLRSTRQGGGAGADVSATSARYAGRMRVFLLHSICMRACVCVCMCTRARVCVCVNCYNSIVFVFFFFVLLCLVFIALCLTLMVKKNIGHKL